MRYLTTASSRIARILIFLFPYFLYAAPPAFDGNQAFTFLYKQVERGARVPGSEAHALAVQDYVDWFEQCDGQVRLQRFTVQLHEQPDISSKTREVKAVNIIAHFGRAGDPVYLFCAHYDTRPWADKDLDPKNRQIPIPGANDGASGVAVLLELARLFAHTPPPMPIEIVLFDVEDSGIPGTNETYCLGSAYYAKHYSGKTPAGAILLDMIGDSDLEIKMEYFSYVYSRSWTEHLFDLAKELRLDRFTPEIGEAVYDDHINLIKAGIPICNLIDMEYPAWHTLADIPSQCSAESLRQVGTLLRYLIYEE